MSFAYNASKLLTVIRGNEFNISSFVYTDSLGTELSHNGNLITLTMLKDMVHGQHKVYQQVLREQAFFNLEIPSHLSPDIDIEKLTENVQCKNTGYSFLDDAQNDLTKYRDSYGLWLISDPSRRERFTFWDGSALVWKPESCIDLLEAFRRCELELAPGLIFSAGPSARGTEFVRMLLRDLPGAPRNLGIVLHHLSLNSTTDKTSHQRLVDHFVPHIPTREWALSLLRYLVIVRPFAERLVEALFAHQPDILTRYRHNLWPGIRQTMSSEDLSLQLGRITEKFLGRKYKIKFWRSLTTVILQHSEEDDVRDIQKQYYSDTVNMHSTKMANTRYAGNTGNMMGADSRIIAGCVQACIAWHKRIGLVDPQSPIPATTSIAQSTSSTIAPAPPSSSSSILKQMKIFQDEALANIRATTTESMAEASRIYFPPPPPPTGSNALRPLSDVVIHPSRLQKFRSFLGKPTAQWSCPEQGVLLEHLIHGKENILGVLGTAAGKTTLIMFLAQEYAQGKTIVVVLPLAALHSDFHRRASQHNLTVSKWKLNGKYNPHAHIVTASIEDLKQNDFIKYVYFCSHLKNVIIFLKVSLCKLPTKKGYTASFLMKYTRL